MAVADDDERDLISAALAGDADAAEEIVRRHMPRIWRTAVAILRRTDLAEDVTQDVLERAFRNLPRFDRSRPLDPWLNRLTVNRCMDALRREARRAETVMEQEPPDHEDRVGAASTRADLDEALDQLADDRRIVLVLRHYLGYQPSEIATLLGVPEGTVASRLNRAMRDLRTILGEHARD